MSEEDFDPPSTVVLHRMVWHPDCYDNGELTSSGAFASRDLNGVRYISVDRHDLFDREFAVERAKLQQANANGVTAFREEVRMIDLPCRKVREIVDNFGERPFAVTAEPENNNPAHCGIRNVSGKRSKSYINQIRAKLMRTRINEWKLEF